MDNSMDPRHAVARPIGSGLSDPTRLCCALTRLSRVLATCVPQTEQRLVFFGGVCDCQAFRARPLRAGLSGPPRLCCALARLSRVLATCVPQTEQRLVYLRGVCDCQAF